jgi:hypothetical protein
MGDPLALAWGLDPALPEFGAVSSSPGGGGNGGTVPEAAVASAAALLGAWPEARALLRGVAADLQRLLAASWRRLQQRRGAAAWPAPGASPAGRYALPADQTTPATVCERRCPPHAAPSPNVHAAAGRGALPGSAAGARGAGRGPCLLAAQRPQGPAGLRAPAAPPEAPILRFPGALSRRGGAPHAAAPGRGGVLGRRC